MLWQEVSQSDSRIWAFTSITHPRLSRLLQLQIWNNQQPWTDPVTGSDYLPSSLKADWNPELFQGTDMAHRLPEIHQLLEWQSITSTVYPCCQNWGEFPTRVPLWSKAWGQQQREGRPSPRRGVESRCCWAAASANTPILGKSISRATQESCQAASPLPAILSTHYPPRRGQGSKEGYSRKQNRTPKWATWQRPPPTTTTAAISMKHIKHKYISDERELFLILALN